MKEKLHLHIGAPKTGSTSIQAFLQENASVLRDAHGIEFPRASWPAKLRRLQAYAEHPEIGSRTRAALGQKLENVERFLDDYERSLHREIEASPARRFVFSSELVCGLQPAQVERLRDLFAPIFERVEVILYLRRQDRLELSAYLQAFKGGYHDGPRFAQPFIARRAGFRQVIETWSNAFGEDALRVRIYERARLPDGDVIRDFADVIGLGDINDCSRSAERNPTWGARQIALAKILGPAGGRVDTDYSRKQPLRNKRLIRFIESVVDERPFLPARQEALRFYEPFREENEWIRARFFPDQETLFDESFEHYPIEGSDQKLSREDLERALVELWEFERNAPALPSNGVAEREQSVDKARAWAGRWVREAKAWWSPR